MLNLFEMTNLSAIEMLLTGIPESMGILFFGVSLVIIAVSIRRSMPHIAIEAEK